MVFGWSEEPTFDKFPSKVICFVIKPYLVHIPDAAGWWFRFTLHCGFIIKQKKWFCKGFVEDYSFVGFVIMETENGDPNGF